MMNKKTTKRALLLSALSLLLCVSMLVGSTFAWFTDTVTSSNNKIVAGNLKVDLLMADNTNSYSSIANTSAAIFGGEESLVAQNDASNTLWEPGKTQIVYLAVENKGTLDLKYNILLSVIDGGLVGALEYAILDNVKSGDLASVTNWNDIKTAAAGATADIAAGTVTAAPNGEIKTSETDPRDYFALAVHMKEEAGNEYQNKDITIDIVVSATQLASENDSFDNTYDEEATFLNKDENGNWLIGTVAELAYFASSVNSGNKYNNETVKLVADIDLAGYDWRPIGTDSTNYFSGNFDGGNHTISNLNVNAATSDNVGLFGSVRDGASIKNVIINNATVTGRARVGALVGLAYSGVAIDNCHATGDINVTGNYKVGGLVGGDYFTMTNCSVGAAATTYSLRSTPTATVKAVYLEKDLEGDCAGGLAGFVAEGSGVMSGNSAIAAVEGTRKVGGIFGYVGYSRTIENNSFSGTVSTNASLEYIVANPGKITVGGIVGEIGTNKGNVILNGNTVSNVTLNGTDNATTGAIVGKDRHANQADEIAALNAASSANVVINLTKVISSAEGLTTDLATGGNFVLANDINGVDANTAITIPSGVEVTLDLNGHKISSTANKSGNQELLLVKGTMTVKNGSLELTAENNQGWNAMSTIFDITAGGVVNLENVVVENKGGTDMAFGVHMNNWGEVTLNVVNSTIKSTYCAVRVNNSGYDMNNVTIKDSTIYSEGNRAFWVHNYIGDLDSSKHSDEAIKARLNFNIFGNGNTYVAETNTNGGVIRYGFKNTVYYTATGAQIKSATTQAELTEAISSGNNVSVTLSEGDYTLPSVSNGDVTISGNENTVIKVTSPAYHGSDVTFNGVTINTSGTNTGIQHVNTVTYNNAIINGEMCLYGEKVVFNNCTFNLTASEYLRTYGALEAEFNNCTFNTAGKALLIYKDGGQITQKVTVKNCTFNATQAGYAGAINNQACAAIEIDNYQSKTTLITEGNTYSDYFSGEWRIKTYADNGNVITVNGIAYTQTAVDGKLMTVVNKEATFVE